MINRIEPALRSFVSGITASTSSSKAKKAESWQLLGIYGTIDDFYDYGQNIRKSIIGGNRPNLPVVAKYEFNLSSNRRYKPKYQFSDVTSPYEHCFYPSKNEVLAWMEALHLESAEESMTGIKSPHQPSLMKSRLNYEVSKLGRFTSLIPLSNKIQLRNLSPFSDEEVMIVADIAHRCIRLNPVTLAMQGVVILGSVSNKFVSKLKEIFPLIQFFVGG
jgi:predicted ATP-binding protein involved in virulence